MPRQALESLTETMFYVLMALYRGEKCGIDIAAWIEELFVEDKFRGYGIGHKFFEFIAEEMKDKIARLRLEVGDENDGAKRLYENLGFEFLDYKQMVIDKQF